MNENLTEITKILDQKLHNNDINIIDNIFSFLKAPCSDCGDVGFIDLAGNANMCENRCNCATYYTCWGCDNYPCGCEILECEECKNEYIFTPSEFGDCVHLSIMLPCFECGGWYCCCNMLDFDSDWLCEPCALSKDVKEPKCDYIKNKYLCKK